jgi:hypothetical protein
VQHRGKELRYIEVVPTDIAVANQLAHEVLGRTLDELSPQTRLLLKHVHTWVTDECERLAVSRTDLRFTRRQVRALTGWGDTQLKIHLGRLAELEYVLIHRADRGQRFDYELLYDGEGEHGSRFLMGLTEANGVAMTAYDDDRPGVNSTRSVPGRATVGAVSGRGRRVAEAVHTMHDNVSALIDANTLPKAASPVVSRSGSYAAASPLAAGK